MKSKVPQVSESVFRIRTSLVQLTLPSLYKLLLEMQKREKETIFQIIVSTAFCISMEGSFESYAKNDLRSSS